MTQQTIHFDQATVLGALRSFLDGFDAIFTSLSHQVSLCVAGTAFDVGSNDPAYLKQAERALATRGRSDAHPCRIAVITAQDALCPAPFWPTDRFEERRIESLLAATPFRMHFYEDLNFWQLFDKDRGIGVQWMAAPDAYPAWDAGSPLRNFVQWALASDDTSLLHSGTLALNGKGLLLAGEGGAGKSSTVLAGIFGGLQSVGDDYVAVDATQLTARPVFDTLKQDETGLRRLGQWDHPAIPRDPNWQGKHQFYMPEVATGPLPASIDLHAILLPELTHGPKTTIAPIDAKSAFLSLAPSGVSQIHCDRARLFSVAAKTARQLPAYRLNLGTAPEEIVGELRRFLENAPWS